MRLFNCFQLDETFIISYWIPFLNNGPAGQTCDAIITAIALYYKHYIDEFILHVIQFYRECVDNMSQCIQKVQINLTTDRTEERRSLTAI